MHLDQSYSNHLSVKFPLNQKLSLCFETNSVLIGPGDIHQLELKRWPLLFKFSQVLIENEGFVSKEKIASFLWPGKKYLPRSVDPKIYDIVRRLKQKIELSLDIPLLIDSETNGYRIHINMAEGKSYPPHLECGE